MSTWWNRLWTNRYRSCLAAAVLAGIALLVRMALNGFAGRGAPYLTFFLATTVSASEGGFWPGLIALIIGGLLAGFIVTPGGWAHLVDPSDPLALLRYLVAGGFVCWVCQALINSRDRARDAEEKLRQSERLLREQRDALERSNRDLEQFAFVASHDLQEPLRIVNIYSDLLLRKLNTAAVDELHQYREFIQTGVTRMSSLIRDVLQYSRVIHGELQISPVDANAAVADAMAALRGLIKEADAEIFIEQLPTVEAALSPLTQVFQNLLSNAIKYRKRDVRPEIRVSAQVKETAAIFEVRDNGIGFEPQYASKIFDLFARLDNDRTEGTGLGLAICKRIIERYGGKIWAESTHGTGARLFFQLPVPVPAGAAQTRASGSGPIGRGAASLQC